MLNRDEIFFEPTACASLRRDLRALRKRRPGLQVNNVAERLRNSIFDNARKEFDVHVAADVARGMMEIGNKQGEPDMQEGVDRVFAIARSLREKDLGSSVRKPSEVLAEFRSIEELTHIRVAKEFLNSQKKRGQEEHVMDAEVRFGRCIWEGEVKRWNEETKTEISLGLARLHRPASASAYNINLDLPASIFYEKYARFDTHVRPHFQYPVPNQAGHFQSLNLLMVSCDPDTKKRTEFGANWERVAASQKVRKRLGRNAPDNTEISENALLN
ncbi:hypothetical protein HDU93_009308 [Gonapodya sp. JEL0774]|nr:hypothetical protein HDU93_009308 [Gonapodya sp. JEL0774]